MIIVTSLPAGEQYMPQWLSYWAVVQAWQPCPLWEPSPSHPILLLTRGLAMFCVHVCLLCVWFVCVLFVPSVLWYCWLGLLTCKIHRPYNLYCVGRDIKHCSIQSNPQLLLLLFCLLSTGELRAICLYTDLLWCEHCLMLSLLMNTCWDLGMEM